MRAPGNDNLARPVRACPYGLPGIALVHEPEHPTHPYRRLTRLPGAVVEFGFATARAAVDGPIARTLPLTGACRS